MFAEVNKMTKKKQREPIFYIQQPAIQFPKVIMQELYSSKEADIEKQTQAIKDEEKNVINTTRQEENEKKELNQEAHEAQKKEEKVVMNKTRQEVNKKKEKSQETFETQNEKNVIKKEEKVTQSSPSSRTKSKPSPTFRRVKSFKEMGTLERLDYLIDFPKQFPPVPCIFEMEGNTIRGFLIGKTEEQIEIKQLDGNIEIIPIQALKEIRMVGLRRKM